MIETLAKAAYEHWINNHPTIHTNRFAPWSELSDLGRESEVNKLRSILKALETPTPEMIEAGVKFHFDYHEVRGKAEDALFRDEVRQIFTAMIRAAQGEGDD